MDAASELEEENPVSAAEQLTRIENCQRQLHQAQQFLQRAEVNGVSSQTVTLANVDIKLRELARQAARLHISGDN